MSDEQIDAIDLNLLGEIQRDGRATYESLSRKLGLSRPATRARLVRLLDSGVVRIVGVAHPAVFGLTAYAHVAVAVEGAVVALAEEIAGMPEAAFVSVIGGEHSLIVELRCTDQSAVSSTIRRIAALPGVRRTATAVYTEILKDTFFPPGHYNPTSIDDLDRRLIELLQQAGRASFADLGAAVGLSTSAARTRVLRLLDSGTVHVGARLHPGALGRVHVAGAGLILAGDHSKAIDAMVHMSEVDYLATAVGRYDSVATLIAHSAEEMLGLMEALRALPGVRALETWTHLRLIKEFYDQPSPT